MTEEMRKRLEEAADIYATVQIADHITERRIKEAHIAGAEYMFKECGGMTILQDMRKLILAQCKEWLFEHGYINTGLFLEADMTKLWEE